MQILLSELNVSMEANRLLMSSITVNLSVDYAFMVIIREVILIFFISDHI